MNTYHTTHPPAEEEKREQTPDSQEVIYGLEEAIVRLDAMASKLARVANDMWGPEPQVDAADSDRCEPGSQWGFIRDRFSRLGSHINRLSHEVDRFDRLA